MSNEITTTSASAPTKVSVINALATKLECDPAKLMPMLKKTAFATCRTDEEFMSMCMVANTYNLNPILNEIYAFPAKGGHVVPIVGVDGWIKLMNSNPAFDGVEFEEGDGYCTAKVYRKDRAHPIAATEWLAECVGNTEPWRRWPRRMLRHKAMIQAARIAFGFAGIYDPDEGERIASVDVPAVVEAPKAPQNGAEAAKNAVRDALGLGSADRSGKPRNAQEPTPEPIPAKDGEASIESLI